MNDKTIALNLRRIRGFRDLSQEEVAEKAGVSLQNYRRIEKGNTAPRVNTLQAVAQALEVKLQDLVTPVQSLTSVRFRALKRMTSREQILADVANWLKDYNEIEEIAGEKGAYKLADVAGRFRKGSPRRPDRAIEAAKLVREALGLAPDETIRDICGLLESAGIKLYLYTLASDTFFGLSVGDEDGGPAIVVNVWDRISVERRMFSAAHELGHLILHQDAFDVNETEESEAQEAEANLFAGHFLMPDDLFRDEWEAARGLPLIPRVMKIKRMFKVSYKTVIYRLIEDRDADNRLWPIFKAQFKASYGQTLTNKVEPFPADPKDFRLSPSEALGAREPERLLSADFVDDRLSRLIRKVIESESISLSRGAEVLRMDLDSMRNWSASWGD